jgi:hypothetical protein
MVHDSLWPLTFDCLATDPLTRMMMDADGVSLGEFTAVWHAASHAAAARDAMVAHGRPFPMRAAARRPAMSARA